MVIIYIYTFGKWLLCLIILFYLECFKIKNCKTIWKNFNIINNKVTIYEKQLTKLWIKWNNTTQIKINTPHILQQLLYSFPTQKCPILNRSARFFRKTITDKPIWGNNSSPDFGGQVREGIKKPISCKPYLGTGLQLICVILLTPSLSRKMQIKKVFMVLAK